MVLRRRHRPRAGRSAAPAGKRRRGSPSRGQRHLISRANELKATMIKTGDLLWTPSPEWVERSNLTKYMQWLARTRGAKAASYDELWRWSVDNLDAFWGSVWDYCGIQASAPYERVLGRREMPGAEWFPGARLNYA